MLKGQEKTATPEGDWKPARIAEGAVRDETDAELAALKAHFPRPRDAVAYIMDTFPIVRRKDEAKHGTYRTKEAILEVYDALSTAIRTVVPYETHLNPLPGPPSEPLPEWKRGHQQPASWPSHVHFPSESI